jgi:hypothetical protein
MHLSSLIDHAVEGIAAPADTNPEWSEEPVEEPIEDGPQTTEETPR